jgi:hypothetical protein
MRPGKPESAPTPLTSGSTTWFARVLPTAFSLLAGSVTLAAWLDLLGDTPASPVVKWIILVVAIGASAAQQWWFGRFRRVWLDGDTLIVDDPRRGLRVPLRDVRAVDESRMQKLKCVKLSLSRPTPMGRTLRFVPRGREGWLVPWEASPVAAALRQRVEALRAGDAHPKALG